VTLALAQSMVNQGWFYAPTQQQQQSTSAYNIPSPIVPPSNHNNLYNLQIGQHNSRLHKDPAIIVEGPVIATSSPLNNNNSMHNVIGQQQRRTVDVNRVMSSQNVSIPPTPPCIMSNSAALPTVTSSSNEVASGGRPVRGRQQGVPGESRPSPPPSTITISSGGTSDEDIDTSIASSRSSGYASQQQLAPRIIVNTVHNNTATVLTRAGGLMPMGASSSAKQMTVPQQRHIKIEPSPIDFELAVSGSSNSDDNSNSSSSDHRPRAPTPLALCVNSEPQSPSQTSALFNITNSESMQSI